MSTNPFTARFTPTALRVVQYYWWGETHEEIGARLGLPVSRARGILASGEAKAILEHLKNNTMNAMLEVNTTLQAIAPVILQEKFRLATEDADSRVRNSACKDLLEMAVGKPINKVQISHTDPISDAHRNLTEDDIRNNLRKKIGIDPEKDLSPTRVLN